MTFSQKNFQHKTKDICLVMRFLETTKKTNVKNILLMLQDIFMTTPNV